MRDISEKAIISFDDFGISEIANEKITELLALGKARRVSIMMNGTLRPEDAQFLLGCGASLDIHLDRKKEIDENRKLKDGAFRRLAVFLFSYVFGSSRPSKVEETWGEQIERFQATFHRLPDGISSHEHVHFFPPYFNVMLNLAKKHNIRYMRFGLESSENYNAVAFVLNILRRLNKKNFLRSGMKSSDFMVSWDWIEKYDFTQYVDSVAAHKTTEIIFHPERPEEFALLQRILLSEDGLSQETPSPSA